MTATTEKLPSTFLFVEGALLVLFGFAAIAFPVLASFTAAVLLGWILIASGVAGLFGAFAGKPHLHFGWSMVSAVIAIVAGLIAAFDPLTGVFALVFVIGAWLVIDGVSSMMLAMSLRRAGKHSWGWSMASAVADWILAAGLFFLAPIGGSLIVGITLGVDLVLGGLALLMTGAALRRG